MSALRVAEMFTSFQGEGPSAGERAAFIRLSGCGVGRNVATIATGSSPSAMKCKIATSSKATG